MNQSFELVTVSQTGLLLVVPRGTAGTDFFEPSLITEAETLHPSYLLPLPRWGSTSSAVLEIHINLLAQARALKFSTKLPHVHVRSLGFEKGQCASLRSLYAKAQGFTFIVISISYKIHSLRSMT